MKEKQQAPFGLRMPDELKFTVKEAAARDGRSMNAPIVQHLRTIYRPADGETPDEFADNFLLFAAANATERMKREAGE